MKILNLIFSLAFALVMGNAVGFATGSPELGYAISIVGTLGSMIPMSVSGFAMAGLFNPAQLTYTSDEIRDMSELIFEKAFMDPKLGVLTDVMTNIRANKKIGIGGRMGLIGKAKAGCAFTADNQIIPFTEKSWDPKAVDIPFSQCVDDLEDSFWIWAQKMGKDRQDLTNTDFEKWFTDLYIEASLEAFNRITWFGATDHANYADSPPGFITDTTDVDYYNILNGLWYQLFDIAATDSDRQYVISENANSTYALQKLAADKGQLILKNLREGADDRLREDGSAVIMVTRSIFDNYMETLRGKAVPESYAKIEGPSGIKNSGYRVSSYDGVPVIEVPFWDRKIKNDFNNGTKYFLPNRAIYTNVDNLAVGLENEDAFANFNTWYSPDNGEWRARGQYSIDAKVLIDSQVQVAF